MSQLRIALLPGDGIGREVTAEAVNVLQALEAGADDLAFEFAEFSAGAEEYLRCGDPLPPETFAALQTYDAVLLGAMGLPDVRRADGVEIAPQLDLREKLDLYRGLRPIRLYHRSLTPLKGRGAGDIDLLIVRENTEGLFCGRSAGHDPRAEWVENTMRISRRGARRIACAAFEEARRRRGKVTLVDKANVLPAMAYFRVVFDEVAAEHPDIEAERVYVDAAALYLVQRPQAFDVIVTENMFGDILSDLAAGIVGGMGMAPSADIGAEHAVFQPSHGSAPDIAGQGAANPVAAIVSAAMMLDWLGREAEGHAVRAAVEKTLQNPVNRTRDIGGDLSTAAMGGKIIENL